jgi:hypothetical protein
MGQDNLEEDDYTAKLICLADECPIGKENAECPLSAAREMPFGEKLHWVAGLSAQEKKEMYRYHVNCFSKKKGCSCCEDHEEK